MLYYIISVLYFLSYHIILYYSIVLQQGQQDLTSECTKLGSPHGMTADLAFEGPTQRFTKFKLPQWPRKGEQLLTYKTEECPPPISFTGPGYKSRRYTIFVLFNPPRKSNPTQLNTGILEYFLEGAILLSLSTTSQESNAGNTT